MLRRAGRVIHPAYSFGLAGLLAGIVWTLAPKDWGPTWFWVMGLIFALLVVPVAILKSSTLLPLRIRYKDAVWAAVILSTAWPTAILAFGVTLMMLSRFRTPVSLTDSMLAMCVGVLSASLCVWAAMRVLTKTWKLAIFFRLFFSGAIVIVVSFAVSNVLKTHQFNSLYSINSTRVLLALLSVLGSALYGYTFGLGLLRTEVADGTESDIVSRRQPIRIRQPGPPASKSETTCN